MNKLLLGVTLGLSLTANAELPADLKAVNEVFENIAIPLDSQDEFKFTSEAVTLEADTNAVAHILKTESSDLIESGAGIETFKVTSLYLDKDAKPEDNLFNTLNADQLAQRLYVEDESYEYGPFFCGAMKINSESGEYLAQNCMRDLKTLTQKIQDLKLNVTLTEVIGNSWGDLKYNVLYVHSNDEDGKMLKIYFDVLHEI